MPKFLEAKLKARYGQNSKIPYKIMNSIGAMRGDQETAKGREMERKHQMSEDMAKYKGKQSGYKQSRPKRKVVSRYQ